MNVIRMGKKKHIALIAHDNRKKDLLEWVKRNSSTLGRHFLCGTGTTAKLISDQTGLPVTAYKSGPLEGTSR